MKLITILSAGFIYLVSIFGAIDLMTGRLKTGPKTVLFVFGLLVFAIQLFNKNRSKMTDIMVLIFALLSSFGFALFISDMVIQPVAVADDCAGHLTSRTHYFDIMLAGFSITLLAGLTFVNMHKQKNNTDRIFSFVFICILLLSFSGIPFMKAAGKYIDKVSEPVYVLPKGC